MELLLRPSRAEDAATIADWFANPVELAKWGGPGLSFPLGQRQFSAWIAESGAPKPRRCISVEEPGKKLLGCFQLAADPANQTERLARFALSPAERGKGLGKAVLARIIGMAFAGPLVHRLELGVWTVNEPARRLYLAAGFVSDGVARDANLVEGQRFSVETMSMLRSEWTAATARQGTPNGQG